MTLLLIKLGLFLAFLALSAFFAGSEIALTSLSTVSIRRLKDRSASRRRHLAFWEEKPNEILATILVGTNLALVGTSVLASSIALDISTVFGVSRAYALTAVPAAAVVGTILLGELTPKIVSRYLPEPIAVFGLPFLIALNAVFRPVNRLLIGISDGLIRLFGRKGKNETPFLRPDELKFLLSSEDTLPLPTPARRIFKNILDFSRTRISQVMVPRADIHAVDLNQDRETVIKQIIEKEYSRIPVYRGNIDNIVGIIYSKDLALAWRSESLFLIDDLIRPVYFVPGSARIDRVLREFKTGHHHLALIVDEFGSTIGLATIEDIVEEIVGEIWDEYDIQEKSIIALPDGSHLIRAGESLNKVSDELKLALPAGDFATIGGWVLDLFGRIPRPGETVAWGPLLVEIVDADKKKVLRIKIRKTI